MSRQLYFNISLVSCYTMVFFGGVGFLALKRNEDLEKLTEDQQRTLFILTGYTFSS